MSDLMCLIISIDKDQSRWQLSDLWSRSFHRFTFLFSKQIYHYEQALGQTCSITYTWKLKLDVTRKKLKTCFKFWVVNLRNTHNNGKAVVDWISNAIFKAMRASAHSNHRLLCRRAKVLCILTRQRVLPMPFIGQNLLFGLLRHFKILL